MSFHSIYRKYIALYLRVLDLDLILGNAHPIAVFVKWMVYLAWLAKLAHDPAEQLIVDNFDDNLEENVKSNLTHSKFHRFLIQ